MCEECAALDKQNSGPLDPVLDSETDQYRGKILRHAILIVAWRLRISTNELARRMQISKSTLYKRRAGRPATPSVFAGLMLRLEALHA